MSIDLSPAVPAATQGGARTLPLDEAVDEQVAGRKAAGLADLRRAGFPAPDGLVVPPDVPDERLTALAAEVLALGPGPYAVRSSGVDEDGQEASFAGLFTTLLDVPAGEVPAAVRRCRASAGGERVTAYRGMTRAPRLAVLVQPMVRARVAGVAFTADPVTGEREVTVVEAVRGLGESLVSGDRTPETWHVRDTRAELVNPARDMEGTLVLTAREAVEVAGAARAVALRAGEPQDVEWALDDAGLVLLQTRPVTALPDPPEPMVEIPVVVPPGSYWQRDPHDNPPQSTYLLGVFDIAEGTLAMAREFGLLLDGMRMACIGGWNYGYIVPLGGKEPPRLPRRLAGPAAWLMLRVLPVARRRAAAARRAVEEDLAWQRVQGWEDGWRAELERALTELRDVDLPALDDDALVAHLGTGRGLVRLGLDRHFRMHGAMAACLGEYVMVARELLGWGDTEAFEALAGCSPLSTGPARALADLARLRGTDAYPAAFEAYLHDWGWRAMRYELATPNLEERPDLLHALVADQASRRTDLAGVDVALAEQRARRLAEAAARLGEGPERDRFERAHARAQTAYPVRESNEFWTISAPLGILRRAVLEAGTRLADRGQVTVRDDAFHLEPDDLERVLLDGSDRHALVQLRRGQLAWALAHPGPDYYGTPAEPPDLGVVPEPARTVTAQFLAVIDLIMGQTDADRGSTETLVHGLGVSPGCYTGSVRVILDESQFGRVRPGDVLVCPATSPVWSVIFPNLGALVTDKGGALSHPAIIAREYGIPAVVDTRVGTRTLHDGQVVTVDGRAGTVTVEQG